MNRSEEGRSDREGNRDSGLNGNNGWSWWLAGAAGVGAGILGGLYLLSRQEETPQSSEPSHTKDTRHSASTGKNKNDDKNKKNMDAKTMALSRAELSPVPTVRNLNSLLSDIYQRYVHIRQDDFELHYKVFTKVIYPLHEAMKRIDPYYGRYSSRFQCAGSHFDRLRIKKPDEFDMDIVISLPVNFEVNVTKPSESDIVIEPKQAGYVQLRAGEQYQKILVRDGADCLINREAHKWLDERKYILRSKFTDWFKGVVDRALNTLDRCNGLPSMIIDGTRYTINKSSSGPAFTLIIRDSAGFKLDVDLVPALRFPERRWLGSSMGYRDIPANCSAEYWMVVPKPIKNGHTSHDADRSWRVAMHDQEKKLIYNSYHLRQVNRLLKKLRDTQGMKYIASYYIKTLFLWKIIELDSPTFWQSDVATIFKVMLSEFSKALNENRIRYFWNKKNNLLETVPIHIIKGYASKLQKLVTLLEDDANYMQAAKFLLTPEEYAEYERLRLR